MKDVHNNIQTTDELDEIIVDAIKNVTKLTIAMLEKDAKQEQMQLEYQIPVECLGNRANKIRGDSKGTLNAEEVVYADDLVYLVGTVDEAKFIVNNYNETFSRFGMTIAKDKTETVAFNCSETIQEQDSLFTIEGVPIKMSIHLNISDTKYRMRLQTT